MDLPCSHILIKNDKFTPAEHYFRGGDFCAPIDKAEGASPFRFGLLGLLGVTSFTKF